MQTTRADTTEAPPAPRTNSVPVVVYQVVVIVPVLAVAIFGIVRYRDTFFGTDLIFWVVLIAAIDLLPVPMWRDVELVLDFPATIAVAMLFDPAIACAALFIGSFSMSEIRGTVQPLRAVFNRAQLAASALAASAAFHAIATMDDDLPTLALGGLAAMAAAYIVSAGLVATGMSLASRQSFSVVLRRMRIGGPMELLVGHLALGVVGVAVAVLVSKEGTWTAILVLVPLALARQAFFRTLQVQRAQQELTAAYAAERRRVAELERLDRAKAEVAQVLTHDFLHAIATLRTYVTALRKKWDKMDEPERIEVSGWIEREADRLKALAEQSVAVMFGDTDGPALSMEPERVEDLVEEAADATNRMDGRLTVDLPDAVGDLSVQADRVRVLQVFRNLLGNAAAYSADGTPIELDVRAEGDEVRFAVRDHGAGIGPEFREVLFRPFSRVPGPATDAVRGSGLGLYISRQIVEAHAGRIGVESDPGEGSEFWFTLRKAEVPT